MGKCAVCLCIMIGVIAIIIGLGAHHLKIFHQIDIRTGAQGKMLLVIKDTHSDYGAPIGDLYNELVPIIETGMKGKDDLEWITFYYDIPDEVLNKKRMRISYGLCTHTPEIQDLAFKLLVEAGKKGFKKRSLPKVEGFKTKFPFKYGISYAIAEYRVIDNLYMSAGKHANWTQKLKEIEFPEETIPFTEKSPVFHAKSIDYFLPLGDRFKEYLFNILAVPAYKQETVDLFKKLKTES